MKEIREEPCDECNGVGESKEKVECMECDGTGVAYCYPHVKMIHGDWCRCEDNSTRYVDNNGDDCMRDEHHHCHDCGKVIRMCDGTCGRPIGIYSYSIY